MKFQAELRLSERMFGDYLKAYQSIDENKETSLKVIIDVDPEEE